ncbi:MAG: hypothetical protein E6K16_06810 [Methanobacteriota archaeon]|nr:MAG: hypothetical protein E6K16_06810 [Euryarchaeota archaeon]
MIRNAIRGAARWGRNGSRAEVGRTMRRSLRGTLVVVIVLSSFVLLGMADRASAAAVPNATEIARAYVQGHLREFGLDPSDLREVVVSSEVFSRDTGVTHVYLQQRYHGIDVLAGILNVNVARDGTVLSAGNRFFSNLAVSAGAQTPRIGGIPTRRPAGGPGAGEHDHGRRDRPRADPSGAPLAPRPPHGATHLERRNPGDRRESLVDRVRGCGNRRGARHG